ncbi:MAG: peptidoglycan-binding protein, partial [Clostridia bacterium]|nr:peptidoglycan-binding protein [Clostridia bacterium]
MNGWEIYEKEAAVTPVPTPTVRPIAVTPDMTLVTNTPAPTVTPAFLANGSQGEMVIQLQQRLQQLGFYTGTVDGQYGNGTKNAVLIFQKQHGLEADG